MIRLSWLISLGISLLGFLIIGNFFTIQPEEAVNNGSLGFIGIILVLPFLLLSTFITLRYILTVTRNTKDRMMKYISVFGGLLLIGVLISLSIDYKNDILVKLSPSEVGGVFNLPKLTEYTYTIYFNFYTFALIHTVVGVIAALFGLFTPKTKEEELPE